MIFIEILRKWVGLPEPECKSCAVLLHQLEIERARVSLLIERVTHAPAPAEIRSEPAEELRPISTGRKFVPFAVRQQMMEANDNKTLEVLKEKWNEIHRVETAPETGSTTGKSNDELEQEILSGAGSQK